MAKLRIVSDGTVAGTKIYCGEEMLSGVIEASWAISGKTNLEETPNDAKAVLVIRGVELEGVANLRDTLLKDEEALEEAIEGAREAGAEDEDEIMESQAGVHGPPVHDPPDPPRPEDHRPVG